MPTYDVLTLGETMLRLTPPGAQRLDQAAQFDIEVGGTESNTAVGLSRLGLRCTWLSRLPDSALGNLVCETLNKHGVDTTHVIRTDTDRIGIYFYEDAPPPRTRRVVYDRKNSAASFLTPEDIPPDFFTQVKPRLLHMTGITPAISESARQTTRHALTLAHQAKVTISFDTNYRANLWSAQDARREMMEQMHYASIILTSQSDLTTVFNTSSDPREALQWLRTTYADAVCVITLGDQGAIASAPGSAIVERPAIPTTAVGRLGGGDAFDAGFLYRWLTVEKSHDKLKTCLDWGVASASLKYATPGDMAIISKSEIVNLLASGDGTSSNVQR